MRELQRSVKQARQSVNAATQSLEEAWRDLGAAAVDSPYSEDTTESIRQAIRDIGQARAEQQQHHAVITEIQDTLAHKDELAQHRKEIPRRIRELEADNRPVFRHLGRQALSLYGHRELTDAALKELFAAPREASRRLADTAREIDRLRTEGSGLGRIRNRIQAKTLQARHAVQQRELDTAAELLGERLLREDVLPRLNDPDLEAAAAGYYTTQEGIRELERQEQELAAKTAELDSRLQKLGALRQPQRRLDELELQDRQQKKAIDTQLVLLGKACFRHMQQREEPTPADVHDLVGRIQALTDQVASEQTRIERLEAAIQLKKLHARRQDLEKRIHHIEQNIASQQKEIEDLRSEIAAGEQRALELEKVRGTLHSLTD
ncbi:hypothetical protein [Spirochaeta africana]|uniref:Uncharacterized protein n=1 Tax=Spirochaeta africana (strain ATCC 700263 / DSM 8902 / Z-7692) TaxID=889378 RepID=H9UI86_SPIAZ|nr:hypothetical protein [Spirochaeta africana]AFG37229.1 hypothetical protein Spiaf_1150 [Spirochaeta africana DSM 8902]